MNTSYLLHFELDFPTIPPEHLTVVEFQKTVAEDHLLGRSIDSQLHSDQL